MTNISPAVRPDGQGPGATSHDAPWTGIAIIWRPAPLRCSSGPNSVRGSPVTATGMKAPPPGNSVTGSADKLTKDGPTARSPRSNFFELNATPGFRQLVHCSQKLCCIGPSHGQGCSVGVKHRPHLTGDGSESKTDFPTAWTLTGTCGGHQTSMR